MAAKSLSQSTIKNTIVCECVGAKMPSASESVSGHVHVQPLRTRDASS